jgi:hypothetical protein
VRREHGPGLEGESGPTSEGACARRPTEVSSSEDPCDAPLLPSSRYVPGRYNWGSPAVLPPRRVHTVCGDLSLQGVGKLWSTSRVPPCLMRVYKQQQPEGSSTSTDPALSRTAQLQLSIQLDLQFCSLVSCLQRRGSRRLISN